MNVTRFTCATMVAIAISLTAASAIAQEQQPAQPPAPEQPPPQPEAPPTLGSSVNNSKVFNRTSRSSAISSVPPARTT